jgi:hypothetical protein
LNRKLRQQQKYATERAERLAAMTPEQLAAHAAWHRTHRPGARAARNAEHERRRQNGEARLVLAQEPRQGASDRETIRIEAALVAARARLAVLAAQNTEPRDNDDEGIFA